MAAQTSFLRLIVVVMTSSAAMMELLDVTIVNVALTQVTGNVGAILKDVAWVIAAKA